MTTSANDVSGKQLLTIIEACNRLLISKSLLRKELLKNKLPVVRIGRRLFIPPASCNRLVRLRTRPFHPYTRGGKK